MATWKSNLHFIFLNWKKIEMIVYDQNEKGYVIKQMLLKFSFIEISMKTLIQEECHVKET